ncbi:hypothetical protein F383_26405 [Gossypium arboreum]|uniref:Uncharacterized protein n=1 Tax=Gossypium arboreum TaxID=29729 RepID=A0A0B0P636_GOSAR|nr:hypothetical protein F383_26405 [Gossypium arboreum]
MATLGRDGPKGAM